MKNEKNNHMKQNVKFKIPAKQPLEENVIYMEVYELESLGCSRRLAAECFFLGTRNITFLK